jgi:hypothetical protein
MLAVTLLYAGCATSPEDESRRQAMEADIAAILDQPLDPEVFGKTKRCLGENEYRNHRALDDRRMLFEGRGNKLWINTLKTTCPDLRWRGDDALVVRSLTARRICESDNFSVAEWFERPGHRRWGTSASCAFGEFQPVTKEQVAEIEEALDSRR